MWEILYRKLKTIFLNYYLQRHLDVFIKQGNVKHEPPYEIQHH